MRVMNQVGFAQLAEFGNIASLGGWGAMLNNMPALKAVQRDLATGKIVDDAVLRDFESLTGIATDWVRYASVSERYTGTTGGEVIGSNLTAAQKKSLELGVKGKRITSVISGMTPITMYSQRLAGKTFIGKLGTLSNKPLKESDRMNFREVGWSDETTDAIMGQLRKATFDNGKLIDLNLEDYNAKVDVKLNENIKIPDDSSARITSSSLLGGNFIDIIPGGSDTYIKPNDTIYDTSDPVSFTDMLGKVIYSGNKK